MQPAVLRHKCDTCRSPVQVTAGVRELVHCGGRALPAAIDCLLWLQVQSCSAHITAAVAQTISCTDCVASSARFDQPLRDKAHTSTQQCHLHFAGECCHAGLHQGLNVLWVKVPLGCNGLQVCCADLAGHLIALSNAQRVDTHVQQILCLLQQGSCRTDITCRTEQGQHRGRWTGYWAEQCLHT